jgi:hypothetical protein
MTPTSILWAAPGKNPLVATELLQLRRRRGTMADSPLQEKGTKLTEGTDTKQTTSEKNSKSVVELVEVS